MSGGTQPVLHGGRPPNLSDTLSWLAEIEREAPESFDEPARLIDRAIADGFIAADARERFAQALLELMDEGYLAGMVRPAWQASAEQTLSTGSGLKLSMKAHAHLGPSTQYRDAGALNFYGTVVAGQIAAGDISNYVSFGELLERAEQELDGLEGIDESTRVEARTVIDALRGRAGAAGGLVLTGAGGQLVGQLLAQLVGLGSG